MNTELEQTSRMRTWREAAGYSLSELADLTGISSAMWSRAERGQRAFAPRTRVLIARRLGVRVGDLFEVEEVDPE